MVSSVIVFARVCYGTWTGMFSTVWSVFVREITPNEHAGFYGGMNQFMITFGIMTASIFGFLVGEDDNLSYPYISRLLMGFPISICIIQSWLLIYVFKSESPLFYKIKCHKRKKIEAFKLIYENLDLALKCLSNEDSFSISLTTIDPYLKLKVLIDPERFIDLFKPPFRRAFLVGCFLWILQQLTGINAVIFYSSFIFKEDEVPNHSNILVSHWVEKVGTVSVGVVNCLSALLGVFMINKFGRKTLLYHGMIGMSIALTLLAYKYKIYFNFINILIINHLGRSYLQAKISLYKNEENISLIIWFKSVRIFIQII